jgi:hypothetical protein
MKTSGKSWAKYIDKSIKAKKSGWRTSSETGERYYEDRPNHSDVSRKDKYEDGGMMAKGGEVKLDADFYEKLQKAEMNWTKDNGKEYNRLMAIKNKAEEGKYSNKKMAKGGKTKKAKEPMIVRSYFEDEAIDYGKGGAISVGDKVKITSSNKTMVVKNISKGKKGYVEFTGSEGTYLIGDLEKFELGGMTSEYCYSIGGL